MARRELGHIQLILGPMFCGKTSELIRRIRRYTVAQEKCIVFKYDKDTRYDVSNVATHDRTLWDAYPCSSLLDLYNMALEHDVIGIDEGQFFPDTVEFAENLANDGKTVIIAALDGDFRRKPFGKILELVPLAEHVVKLAAVCMDCRQADAPYSKRTVNNENIELIGGADMYKAVCRSCYHGKLARALSSSGDIKDTNPNDL